jgi:hypothetical protein
VLNSKHRDKVSGEILRGTFLRRAPKQDGTIRDRTGLSVFLFVGQLLSGEEIITRIRRDLSCFAICSLGVGAIRDIVTEPKLDVKRDAKEHAELKGLPPYGEDDAKAERLATKLAKLASPLWSKP